MKLTTAHQVLIVSFILLGALFAWRSLWDLSQGGGARDALLAAAGVAAALAGALYLRRFRKRLLEKSGESR